jgi:AcrR family transcriptional regulator
MDKTARVSGKLPARNAILAAFRDIVLARGYDTMRVMEVVQRSGVARSTFYEHFQSREDLLRESLRWPLDQLASLVERSCDLAVVEAMLEHMAENSALTRSLLISPGTDAIVDVLTNLIECREPNIPEVRARAIAGAQMAIVSSWLHGRGEKTTADVVRRLREIAVALRSFG